MPLPAVLPDVSGCLLSCLLFCLLPCPLSCLLFCLSSCLLFCPLSCLLSCLLSCPQLEAICRTQLDEWSCAEGPVNLAARAKNLSFDFSTQLLVRGFFGLRVE